MFVFMFFSASLVMAGGIATGMEWLSAKGAIPARKEDQEIDHV
jgi:hypothetical protein